MKRAPSLDDEPLATGADAFNEAAGYFLLWYPTRGLTRSQVADGLSRIADAGYIVHPADHERLCNDYAARLAHCEAAADELVRRVHGGDR
jgi:hypothetical protein